MTVFVLKLTYAVILLRQTSELNKLEHKKVHSGTALDGCAVDLMSDTQK